MLVIYAMMGLKRLCSALLKMLSRWASACNIKPIRGCGYTGSRGFTCNRPVLADEQNGAETNSTDKVINQSIIPAPTDDMILFIYPASTSTPSYHLLLTFED